jgi:hypothetical protein
MVKVCADDLPMLAAMATDLEEVERDGVGRREWWIRKEEGHKK